MRHGRAWSSGRRNAGGLGIPMPSTSDKEVSGQQNGMEEGRRSFGRPARRKSELPSAKRAENSFRPKMDPF